MNQFLYFAEFGDQEAFRSKFKKTVGKVSTIKKAVPKTLKVAGYDPDAKMKGYLYFRGSKTSEWKKRWFVLKHSVLYELRAPEDPVSVDDTVILGYSLEPEYILEVIQCFRKLSRFVTMSKVFSLMFLL